jgi:hypothetical protein
VTLTGASSGAHGDVRPLLARGRLVTVDGHPVCETCGSAVAPAADRWAWAHVPPGRPLPRRSAWFKPVTWRELRGLGTYREFVARYPWAARPEEFGGVVTSEADWREGVRRLRDYHELLASVRRRRGPRGARGAPAAGGPRGVRPGENPQLDLACVLAGGSGQNLSWSVPGGLDNVLNLPARRRELTAMFSWAIPGEGALAVLGGYGPLVESGAGTGYWAALLRARGVDVVASDIARGRSPWTEVTPAHAVAAVRASRDRTLFVCWPPYDDDAASYAAVRAYRGENLLYVGGALGGPTGTVRFHTELELNWTAVEQVAVPNWPGLRDRLVVYRRNPVRRALTRRNRCPSCHRFMPTGSAGRCDACFARCPPAMALRINGHRVEYPREVVDAMPAGLRLAFERSPSLISVSGGLS